MNDAKDRILSSLPVELVLMVMESAVFINDTIGTYAIADLWAAYPIFMEIWLRYPKAFQKVESALYLRKFINLKLIFPKLYIINGLVAPLTDRYFSHE